MAKHKLFGNHIEPNCTYCGYNHTPDSTPTCRMKKSMGNDGRCPSFSYNPLLRKPQKLPPLQRFDPEDFKL